MLFVPSGKPEVKARSVSWLFESAELFTSPFENMKSMMRKCSWCGHVRITIFASFRLAKKAKARESN